MQQGEVVDLTASMALGAAHLRVKGNCHHISEIDAIRAHLDLERVSPFGNSWGGTLAAAYAARRPAGLERVVLSSPLLHTGRWIADNQRCRKQLPAETQALMVRCESDGKTGTDGTWPPSTRFTPATCVVCNPHRVTSRRLSIL